MLLSDFAYVLTPKDGVYHAILFWGGRPDYRGSATDFGTALDLLFSRKQFILHHREGREHEATRIACPDGLWPETRESVV